MDAAPGAGLLLNTTSIVSPTSARITGPRKPRCCQSPAGRACGVGERGVGVLPVERLAVGAADPGRAVGDEHFASSSNGSPVIWLRPAARSPTAPRRPRCSTCGSWAPPPRSPRGRRPRPAGSGSVTSRRRCRRAPRLPQQRMLRPVGVEGTSRSHSYSVDGARSGGPCSQRTPPHETFVTFMTRLSFLCHGTVMTSGRRRDRAALRSLQWPTNRSPQTGSAPRSEPGGAASAPWWPSSASPPSCSCSRTRASTSSSSTASTARSARRRSPTWPAPPSPAA